MRKYIFLLIFIVVQINLISGCSSQEKGLIPGKPSRFANASCTYNLLDGECQYLQDGSILCSMGQCNEGNCTSGKGKISYPGGTTIEGVFKNGKIDGVVDLRGCGGVNFIGVQKDNSLKGKHIFSNGEVYEGTIIDGMKQGKGVYTDINGVVYNGNWKDDIREGRFIISGRLGGNKRILTYINGKDDDERERDRQNAMEEKRQQEYEFAVAKRKDSENLEWHRKFLDCNVFKYYKQCNRNVTINFINSESKGNYSVCGKILRSEKIYFQCQVNGYSQRAMNSTVVYLFYDQMGNCSSKYEDLCKY